jgi:endoglycosylceramidase
VTDPEQTPRGANVKGRALEVLDRPHPMAVAGTPREWHWNAERRTFDLEWSTTSPGDGRDHLAPTEVWTSPMHYLDGRRIAVDGARVIGRRRNDVLNLRNLPGAAEARLRIAPR